MLAPNPGIWNFTPPDAERSVLHPNLVKFPKPVTIGGMMSLPLASLMQGAGTSPAPATPLSPVIMFTATFLIVSTTTTSKPMRSETKNRWLTGSTMLMSKELNGPPGAPVGLCSGTGMMSMMP